MNMEEMFKCSRCIWRDNSVTGVVFCPFARCILPDEASKRGERMGEELLQQRSVETEEKGNSEA